MMNCTKCNIPLSIDKQAEILDAEVQLTALTNRPIKLPDAMKVCDDCLDVMVGEKDVQ